MSNPRSSGIKLGRLATEPPHAWWSRHRRPRAPKASFGSPAALSGARLWALACCAPALALVVVFFLYPFGVIVYHAFTQWDGIGPSRFTGLTNVRDLLSDSEFRLALRNNAIFALAVPLQVAISLVLAVLIYERTPGWRIFRAIFFLPVVMSPIVIGLMWTAIFDLHGPLNVILGDVGLSGLTRDWLGDPSTSIPAIMLVVLWATFGFNVTIFLAGLSAMSPILLDAARVDGGGWWASLRHVVIPSQRRVTELVVVLNLITSFAYMLPFVYVMTGGGPGYETYVGELVIYDEGFNYGDLGYASAVSLALFLVVSVLMLAYVRILKRAES
ncbi:MAG: raffinose/stachyose/melibiose transport system permease protein [Gaiellaceae bacterium]|nr:raffinose/stachyose/melibiose transport system permease protein [Gaiellaceae bacterium]